MGQTTYALLNEYIPEIQFSGRLNTADQVSEGETVEFNAGASKFVSDADYNKIQYGFYNFPKNYAENVTGYPKYFFDKRINADIDCSGGTVSDAGLISYVTLTGYDSSKSDEENLPYVALRCVYQNSYIEPDNTVRNNYAKTVSFGYKIESFGTESISGYCVTAPLYSFVDDDGDIFSMNVCKRLNGKTVISAIRLNETVPDTGDLSGLRVTNELVIDWSLWHEIKLVFDYTKAFINADAETIQGHNATYCRLYIDDVFIPFVFEGASGDFCYGNVYADGSLYPSGTNSGQYLSEIPDHEFFGFTFGTQQPDINMYDSIVLYRNYCLNRYVGQNTDVNADWYRRTNNTSNFLYLETGLLISHEIEKQNSYLDSETNLYRVTVYNQWGSSRQLLISEQFLPLPNANITYTLQGGSPVTVTTDADINLPSVQAVDMSGSGTTNITMPDAYSFYPWETSASTHDGYSLQYNTFSTYPSGVSFVDDWMCLTQRSGLRGCDARFRSNVYSFETLEFYFRVTSADVTQMLQETGMDQAFYIPILMFGVFTAYNNHRLILTYNPKVNLDSEKSVSAFGHETEGVFSLCRFEGSDLKKVYFTYPKLKGTDIYHIALCYRVSQRNLCMLFINGVCVFKEDNYTNVIDYADQKSILETNSGAVNWIPVTMSLRSLRQSFCRVYDVNYNASGCFDFVRYPNGRNVDDSYYTELSQAMTDCKYFDPAVLYPDNKLTYQVINTDITGEWYRTIHGETEKISDDSDITANIYRDSTYTLLAKNSIGGNPAALNLNFNLQIPPTAVITTDSLVVYKGAYVTLSGADSFDNITAYEWSNGSTAEEIQLLITETQTVSLKVTNAYGTDTASVQIKCKETPVVDKSLDLVTVSADALEIPLSAIPYQELYIILNNQNCYITLRQLGDFIYCSLRVDEHRIFDNVICNINAPVNVYPSPYFSGILQFYDEKGTDKPHYSELGSRWKLKYRASRLTGEVY